MIAAAASAARASSSRTRKRWSLLQMMIGAAKPPASIRARVAPSRLPCPLKKRMNCLGYIVRDSGHRRVPEPPDRITGTIIRVIFHGKTAICPADRWRFTSQPILPGLRLGMLYSGCGFPHKAHGSADNRAPWRNRCGTGIAKAAGGTRANPARPVRCGDVYLLGRRGALSKFALEVARTALADDACPDRMASPYLRCLPACVNYRRLALGRTR